MPGGGAAGLSGSLVKRTKPPRPATVCRPANFARATPAIAGRGGFERTTNCSLLVRPRQGVVRARKKIIARNFRPEFDVRSSDINKRSAFRRSVVRNSLYNFRRFTMSTLRERSTFSWCRMFFSTAFSRRRARASLLKISSISIGLSSVLNIFF